MFIMKNKYLWIGILILAAIIRLWGFGLNPVGLTHDEIHQFVYAKSVWFTGHGAAGTAAGAIDIDPYCDGNCVFGELPSWALAPWAALPLTFPWIKLPFVLLSLGLVFVVGKLFERLTENKNVGLITGLLMAVNPWAVFFGRSAYENIFSYFLYFLGILILVGKNKTLKYQILGVVTLLLASLGYFGAKVWYLPILFVTLIFGYTKEKKEWKKYLLLLTFGLVIFGAYMIILKNSVSGLRLKEVTFDWPVIQAMVNDERRMSLNIPFGKEIWINKYTVSGKQILSKYFAPLSANFLFNIGEQGYDHFMIAGHPFFYLIDILGIIFGLSFIFGSNFILGTFILALIAIGPLPGAISNYASTYAMRAGMLYPVLVGLSAAGWWFMFSRINKGKKILAFILAGIYFASFIYFWQMYWGRNSFEKSSGWVFYEREVVKYIELMKNDGYKGNIFVVTSDPVDVIYEWGVFSGRYNQKEFIQQMNQTIASREYVVDGIAILKKCPEIYDRESVYLVSSNMNCMDGSSFNARISDPRDSGTKYYIQNDWLCSQESLSNYPYPTKISDFNITKIDSQNFCKLWVSKP